MQPAGYDLWVFPSTVGFGESTPATGLVAALPPETIIFKAVYLRADEVAKLDNARQRLATRESWGREDVYLLRPTASSDGPPFRSTLIYRAGGKAEVKRFDDPRVPQAYNVGVYLDTAIQYSALRVGGPFMWESDIVEGRPGFFLTGTSGTSSLWRLVRLEADALDRQVLTLAPVRLAHGVVAPNFEPVGDIRLRAYLSEQFGAFQRAVAASAYLEVVDRAGNIAEAVLGYCLTRFGRDVPGSLAARLTAARAILDDKELRQKFLLTRHGYHLAHKIRELHARSHADQAMERGGTVRPEVGMSLVSDLSELLVEVGLARY